MRFRRFYPTDYMRYLYLFLCLLICSLFSCDDEDLKAIIPAYLKVDDVVVVNTPILQKVWPTDKITDINVFVNDQFLGTFELPALIPIQQTGNVTLKIRAVIFNNGMSNDRQDYPFYSTYELDTTFVPEQELYLRPEVEYFKTLELDGDWGGEDFEVGVAFNKSPTSESELTQTGEPEHVFNGNRSGVAHLNINQQFFETYTREELRNIPRTGEPIYLEFNYKSSHPFTLSIYTNNRTTQQAILSFRPRSSYTKVYVELTTVIATLFTASNYNLAFGYRKPLGENGSLYLDNIKLLYFQ